MNKLRYKNSWVDFRWDGVYSRERIKGKTKRNLRKWTDKKMFAEYLKGEDNETKMQLSKIK